MSFTGASAAVISAFDRPITRFTYAATFRCSARNRPVIRASSATAFEFKTREPTDPTSQRPRRHSTTTSKSVSRCPHFNGSDNTTSRPDFSFTTRRSGTSTCACPTKIASIPGTRSATNAAAFSTYGN